MIIGIVAISKDYAIGKGGRLPWHHRADLKFFKETTTGHAILMGSRTWRSIGRPLPNRLNIVLSRSGTVDVPPEVKLLTNRDQVLTLASTLGTDLFIAGGAEIFSAFADDLEKWVVTDIPVEVPDADTYMPRDFLNDFKLESTRDLGEGLNVRFLTRER